MAVMKRHGVEGVLYHLQETVRRSQKVNVLVKKEDRLRSSSFPFCGLRLAYEKVKYGEDHLLQPSGAQSEFYTSVGTLTHRIIQTWGSRVKMKSHLKLIGDRFCRKCGSHYFFSERTTCCGKHTEYREVRVSYKDDAIFGHVDGVLYDTKRDVFWVVDYKTTNSTQFLRHQSRTVYPYKENVAQLESYMAMMDGNPDILETLREQEPKLTDRLNVVGGVLIYMVRDNPFVQFIPIPVEFSEERKKIVRDRLDKYIAHFELAKKPKTNLKQLVKEKPCGSESYYLENMHKKFDPCPLAEKGTCFHARHLKKELLSVARQGPVEPEFS